MEDSTRSDLIKGGIRTLVQFVPGVGGAFSQAWSEYEAHRQNQRVDEFFNAFGVRMVAVEAQIEDLSAHVQQLGDASELLEEIVDSVKRETQAEKRGFYVNALVNFVREPKATTRDERRSIIENLDTLTIEDLSYLSRFMGGALRGDMVSETSFAQPSSDSQRDALEKEYEKVLGPAIHSLAKLEGRGLIVQTEVNAMYGSTGDESAWYNRFRRRAWRITPIGEKALRSIQG